MSFKISGGAFRIWTIFSLLFLLAGTVGFHYIINFIVEYSGCQGDGGACGAVAMVAEIYLKPLIFVAAGIVFLLGVAGRMHGSFSPLWFLFVLSLAWNFAAPFILHILRSLSITDAAINILFRSHSEFYRISPIIILTILLNSDIGKIGSEYRRVSATRGPINIPIGQLYSLSAIIIVLSVAAKTMIALYTSEHMSSATFDIIHYIDYSIINNAAIINAVSGLWIVVLHLRAPTSA